MIVSMEEFKINLFIFQLELPVCLVSNDYWFFIHSFKWTI